VLEIDLSDVMRGRVAGGGAAIGPPDERGKVKCDQNRYDDQETNHCSAPPLVGPVTVRCHMKGYSETVPPSK